jgi:hypothetical protein
MNVPSPDIKERAEVFRKDSSTPFSAILRAMEWIRLFRLTRRKR